MNWFTLSLLSAIALASAELTQQHLLTAKNPFTARTSAVLTFLIQSIFALPLIFLLHLFPDFHTIFQPNIFIKILLMSLLSSIAMVFYLRSFQVKNISFSTIFISLSVVISTTLGITFFNESLNISKLIGISLVLGAIVSLHWKNPVLEKNHLYGLLAGAIFGIVFTLDKSIVLNINPLLYIFLGFPLISLWGFIFFPREIINSIKTKTYYAYKPVIISGIGYFLFNIFTFYAYRLGGEVGRVDAINNTQTFIIILFEYFILKHTKSLVRKIITAVIAFVGIYILGNF